MLVPVTQHSDFIFLCFSIWSPMISLVIIYHHTKILHNYLTIFPTVYILYLWLIYFVTESLYLLISLTYSSPPFPAPTPLATTSFFSVSMTLFLLCYVYLFILSFASFPVIWWLSLVLCVDSFLLSLCVSIMDS